MNVSKCKENARAYYARPYSAQNFSFLQKLLKILFISTRRDTAVVFTCDWMDDLGADSLQTFSPTPLVEEKHHLEQCQSARSDPPKLRQSIFSLCTKMRGGTQFQKFKLSSLKLVSQEG